MGRSAREAGMSSGQGLLQDIIEHPGDDALRRIYADWLDDDGQHDRAEFLRVQLDLAGMEEDDPRRNELEVRQRQLLERYEAEWLDGVVGEVRGRVRFDRGLPSDVYLDAAQFARWGEEV